jgi:hypothetical protein
VTTHRIRIQHVLGVLGISLLANAVLAPLLGVALSGILVYGQPTLVLRSDIAGVPAVLYGVISTLIPVVVLTFVGHFGLFFILKSPLHRSRTHWLAAGSSLGALSGLLASGWLDGPVGLYAVGALVGGACGAAQAAIWWKGICNQLVDAA